MNPKLSNLLEEVCYQIVLVTAFFFIAMLVLLFNSTAFDHKAQLNRVIELLEKKP